MKVLDLHCSQGHVFEGWFASEQDFQQQRSSSLLQCPVCGCMHIEKGLSAPRLNLGATEPHSRSTTEPQVQQGNAPDAAQHDKLRALQAAWLQMSRQMVQNTQDVGERFAETALRMHRGEEEEKPIRGQATPEQAKELLQEGVPVLPLLLPKASTETLQ